MKINSIEVSIQKLEIEQVEGTLIMYDSISKKIIVFNETASFVWNIVTESERTNDNINTCEIVDKISQKYNVSEIEQTKIRNDVEEILKKFFDSGLFQPIY